MLKVIQYLPGFSYGGIETFVINMNKQLKEECEFTYVVEKDIDTNIERDILEQNSKIIRIPNMKKEGILKHIFAVVKIFKKQKYDIVHIHGSDSRFIVTIIAKIFKIKKIIYHVHTVKIENETKLKKFIRIFNIKFASTLMACSEQAAKAMFGKKKNRAQIINVGIETDKFKFDSENRKEIREKLGVKNQEILIGNVGRMELVKNQIYLLKILKEIIVENNNVKLLLIGDGKDKNNLHQYMMLNNLENNVIFLGKVNDVYRYYSAMDIFCFPSLYEGFGIVLLEAQANGLICLASKNVPNQTNVTNQVKFLDIRDEDISEWKKNILLNKFYRTENVNKITENGMNIKDNAKQLLKVYKKWEKK